MAPPERVHRQTSERVLTHLRSGVSVEVVATPGSGRSALAEGVRSALALEGYQPLTVRGLFHLRDRPLESLYVSGVVDPPSTPRGRSAIASTVDSLAAVVARRPTVVVVDDLDDVDEATLGVLSAVHRRVGCPVLSVSRPSPRVPTGQARPHGLALRPGVQVRLPPLRLDDVHAVVIEVLGGQVDPDVVRWVARRSGGLAGLVLAVTGTARHDGSLVLRDGTWSIQHRRWSPLLSAVVDRMTEHTSPEALEGLHKLSLVGSCEHGVARRLVGPAVLEELDDRQLVHLVPTADRLVAAVFPPLVAEHFRGSRVSVRRTRLLEEISAALPAAHGRSTPRCTAPGGPAADCPPHAEPPPDEHQQHDDAAAVGTFPAPITVDRLRTVGGLGTEADARPVADARRAEQATTSTRRSDTVLTQMLAEHRAASAREARAAWEADPTWDTATPYLRELLVGDLDRTAVESVLTTTTGSRDAASLVEGTLWQARYLAIEGHDLAAAVDVLTALEPRAADLGASEVCLWSIRLERLRLETSLDRVTPDHGELLLRADSTSPDVRAAIAVHQAGLLVVGGRPCEALGLLDVTTPDPDLAAHRDVVRGLALALSGDVDGALTLARRHLHEGRETLSVDHLHAHAYVASIVLCIQGRTEELRENLSSALTLGGSPLTMRFFQAGNLSVAATVAMLDGRRATATALVEELESLGLPPGNLPAMSPVWARGTVAHLAGVTGSTGTPLSGADQLWSEAVGLLERGFVAAGIFTGVGAVELAPDPGRAQRLVAEAEATDGSLLADLAGYASAVCSEDPERMVAVGDRLVADDRPLYGLRAYTAAVRTWRSQGLLGRAAAQFAATQQVAAGLGPGYLERLDPFEVGADLTHREQEVARLVTQGRTNQEIAESLVLSVRTVENHLHRAYRKVGVDNRQDLCAALTLDT